MCVCVCRKKERLKFLIGYILFLFFHDPSCPVTVATMFLIVYILFFSSVGHVSSLSCDGGHGVSYCLHCQRGFPLESPLFVDVGGLLGSNRSCQIAFSSTAPAQPYATRVAVYPALFKHMVAFVYFAVFIAGALVDKLMLLDDLFYLLLMIDDLLIF